MLKYFIAPLENKDKSGLFKASFIGNDFKVELIREIDSETVFEQKTEAYFILDSKDFFFRNHDFPFTGRKKIEKIIDFELSPFFPSKKNDYEFVFQQLKIGSGKESAKAFCMASSNLYLNEKETSLFQQNIDIIGFIPCSYYQVLCLQRLSIIKDDCLVLIKEDENTLILYSVTNKNILGCKRIVKTDNVKNIVSGINLLTSYTDVGIKPGFSPETLIIVDCFDLKNLYYEQLVENVSHNIEIFGDYDLGKHINITSETNLGYLLCIYELFYSDLCIFRKKSPGIKKFIDIYRTKLAYSFCFFVLAFSMIGVHSYSYFKNLKSEYINAEQAMHESLKVNFPQIKRITGSCVDQAKIEIIKAKKSNQNSEKAGSDIKKINLLKEIISNIPQNEVELENITILPVLSSITGIAGGYDLIDKMKKDIEASKVVGSVEISMATTDNSGKIRFRLEVKLNE